MKAIIITINTINSAIINTATPGPPTVIMNEISVFMHNYYKNLNRRLTVRFYSNSNCFENE